MKLKNTIIAVILASALGGCATTDGWVYDERDQKYLTGKEIKNLVSGSTVVYFDNNGTKEYYHENGIVYSYFQTDEEYHNSRWCIIENKLCLDSVGFKLICPKITLKKNGELSYDQDTIKIEQGDTYEIKKAYDENDWEIHAKKKCI